jgi:hypothetical protein
MINDISSKSEPEEIKRSKPKDIQGKVKSFYNEYVNLKESGMLHSLTNRKKLDLLVNAIEEMAKRDLRLAKKLYSEDFKNLEIPENIPDQEDLKKLNPYQKDPKDLKDSYQKYFEKLLGIKKSK